MAKIKRLKNRHVTASDSDKYTIRLLRQEFYINEQQHTMKYIDDEEYQNNLQTLDAKITALEDKYGMDAY